MKNILFVASECVPFIKTGGLADVAGALPKSLDKNKYDVRVVLPDYACIPEKYRNEFQYVHHFYMDLGKLGDVYVGIMTCQLDGITYYFIDNQHYFSDPKPYGDIHWDIEKFCYFSKAALAILPVVGFHPDVIHCHDWQTGVLPVMLHTVFKSNPFFHNIRTIMTIHNLKFQGVWDIETMKLYTNLPDDVFITGRMEFKKDANMLKGGLVYADRITTVSDTYAWEIQLPYYGEGLDGLLYAKRNTLSGIVNGIDYDIYNPETDPKIVSNYTAKTVTAGKKKNKMELQKELGLPVDPDVMMIGMITRLTDQKGFDLVEWVIGRLLQSHIQLVVLGTGVDKYENLFRHLEWSHKDKVSSSIYFNDERAHKIYASSDAILMPSRFEPCGLTQLIALRYGAVPIVRETGGLKDTVEPYNEFAQTGTGFSFANYNADEMLASIFYAEQVYYDNRKAWDDMVLRGMAKDFSWNSSAKKYEALYDSL